jgi:hypothetical protein
MARLKPCPFRSVELGRLFCALATREGERSTARAFMETCEACDVARTRGAHPCRNLDIGLDIRAHRERSTIDEVYLACNAYKIALTVDTVQDCTPNCPEWSLDASIGQEPEPEAPAAPEPPKPAT